MFTWEAAVHEDEPNYCRELQAPLGQAWLRTAFHIISRWRRVRHDDSLLILLLVAWLLELSHPLARGRQAVLACSRVHVTAEHLASSVSHGILRGASGTVWPCFCSLLEKMEATCLSESLHHLRACSLDNQNHRVVVYVCIDFEEDGAESADLVERDFKQDSLVSVVMGKDMSVDGPFFSFLVPAELRISRGHCTSGYCREHLCTSHSVHGFGSLIVVGAMATPAPVSFINQRWQRPSSRDSLPPEQAGCSLAGAPLV